MKVRYKSLDSDGKWWGVRALDSPRKHRRQNAFSKYKWIGHCECHSYLIVFTIVFIVYSLFMLEKKPFIGLKEGDVGVISVP